MKKKKSRFIDFKQLKRQVSIQQVLEHYQIFDDLEGEGNSLSGHCPVCESESDDLFRVSLEKNCWNCFGDCSGGNILDLVSELEECSIREAAVKISDWFSVESVPIKKVSTRKGARKSTAVGKSCTRRKKTVLAEVTDTETNPVPANKPLGFELELDSDHPLFDELCLSDETIEEFGLGYCDKGFFKGHIAFPIHNRDGEIVAYGGMSADGEEFADPMYKYPEADKFDPSLELFGLYYALRRGRTDVVYLVSSPLEVFRVWHADGVSAVCALSDISEGEYGKHTKDLLANCLAG